MIHITDAEFHDPEAPGATDGYHAAGITDAHTRAQTITALDAMHVRVMGVSTEADARADLEDVATETGAYVPPTGGSCPMGIGGSALSPRSIGGELMCPLVYDARDDGSGLATTIVSGVATLVGAIRLNSVSARVRDDPYGFFLYAVPQSATPPAGGGASGFVNRAQRQRKRNRTKREIAGLVSLARFPSLLPAKDPHFAARGG